jgi:hypothetical protein
MTPAKETLSVSRTPEKPSFTGVNYTSVTLHMLSNLPRYSNSKLTQQIDDNDKDTNQSDSKHF